MMCISFFDSFSGATLSKSLNRGFATFFAGALGVGAQHLACLFGEKGEPIVLGMLVFLLGILKEAAISIYPICVHKFLEPEAVEGN